ncbi:SDR family NAD(P)-dependent oxidoreductase [Hominisplanchenecus murintestinalis]|uniref:SDR family NAD(P)-dependent oxidoreductase n=1 Tax=Hominisplanchenecus murintestinalis TaxID=2941517 RepID=UPI002ED06DC0
MNNAGFGNYGSIGNQNLEKISRMLHLNVETLTIFSSLFVRDFKDTKGTQLINVSSCGGYTIVPNAVTYCAAKFYVSILYRNESYT